MSLIEPNSVISLEEYLNSKSERLHETDLRTNDIYTSKLLLELRSKKNAAAKVCSRILDVTKDYGGATILGVEFLDEDFQPVSQNSIRVVDGLIEEFEDDFKIRIDHIISTALTGYFHEDTDEFDDFLNFARQDVISEMTAIE